MDYYKVLWHILFFVRLCKNWEEKLREHFLCICWVSLIYACYHVLLWNQIIVGLILMSRFHESTRENLLDSRAKIRGVLSVVARIVSFSYSHPLKSHSLPLESCTKSGALFMEKVKFTSNTLWRLDTEVVLVIGSEVLLYKICS